MPDSARGAQRAEFRKLTFHILNEINRVDERDPALSGKPYSFADMSTLDAQWIERALDNYQPLIDAAAVENELGPALLTLEGGARRGGLGTLVSNSISRRVMTALELLRGR